MLLALSSLPAAAEAGMSHLVPSDPWLTAPAPAATPVAVATRQTLPSTGFPVAPELLIAGALLCSGTALRARLRHRGVVRLEPALARRR